MQTLAWVVGSVLLVVLLVLGLPYFADRITRGGSGSGGGNALGVMGEIFNPGAAKSSLVIKEMKERKSSAALGDGEDPDAVTDAGAGPDEPHR